MSAAIAARPRVIIVPTLNERENIVACLDALRAALPDSDLLVVDDGSADGTLQAAREWARSREGAHVLVREDAAVKAGLGHALRHAWDVARDMGYRAACIFDADLQQDPADARRLIDAVEGAADIAVGARRVAEDGSRSICSVWAAAILRRLSGQPWQDPTTDFLAIRLDVWTPALTRAMRCRGLLAPFELRWRATLAGRHVVELDAACRPRALGRSHRGATQTARAARDLLSLMALAPTARRFRGASALQPTFATQAYATSSRRLPEQVRGRLASGTPLKLHVGCGRRYLPGWVHVDIDPWPHVDLCGPAESLPMLSDGIADEIYSCHQIAYYDRSQLPAVLAEWRRLLAPGGRLRIATADFAAVVAAYRDDGLSLAAFDGLLHGRYPRSIGADSPGADDVDVAPLIYYRTTHDRATLSAALEAAGFIAIRGYDWRATNHADVDDYAQAYLPHMDKAHGRLMSLNIEAHKPAL